jgi:L,D-transpeptidase ErfK/SrfK
MKAYVWFLLVATALPAVAWAGTMVGGDTVYETQKGDCLRLISAKVGVEWQIIARTNGIDSKDVCKVGASLGLDNRKIIPKVVDNGIIVNIPDKMLYLFKEGKILSYFPVGLGSPDFPTPTGSFTIERKDKNPTWHVPKAIQIEMEKKGKVVKAIVPPGPENPLGRFALYTSLPGILIHETIWPTTVYQWRSHGCIRVLPSVMEDGFFDNVDKGMVGEIIYRPVSVAVSLDGKVYLQVSRDIYKRMQSTEDEARREIEKQGLSHRVDWNRVKKSIREKSGVAEDITL